MDEVSVVRTVVLSTVLVAITLLASAFAGPMIDAQEVLEGFSVTVLGGVVLGLLVFGAGLSNVGFQVRNLGIQVVGGVLTFVGFFVTINWLFSMNAVGEETVQTIALMAILYFVALCTYAYRQHKARFSNWEIPAAVGLLLTVTLMLLSQDIKTLEPFVFIVGTLVIMAHMFFVAGLTKRVKQGTMASITRLYTAFIALPIDVLLYLVFLVRHIRE